MLFSSYKGMALLGLYVGGFLENTTLVLYSETSFTLGSSKYKSCVPHLSKNPCPEYVGDKEDVKNDRFLLMYPDILCGKKRGNRCVTIKPWTALMFPTFFLQKKSGDIRGNLLYLTHSQSPTCSVHDMANLKKHLYFEDPKEWGSFWEEHQWHIFSEPRYKLE